MLTNRRDHSSAGSVQVYVAATLALTDPGPAAAGVVVFGPTGRLLHRRAAYLGIAARSVAQARALIAALRLVCQQRYERPTIFIELPDLARLLDDGEIPADLAPFRETIRALAAAIPGLSLHQIEGEQNPARETAAMPLVEWLPARTRRAERLAIRCLGPDLYEVGSARIPGQQYLVWLPQPGMPGQIACSCPDFQYRGIPCKHLLAVVARSHGGMQRLFSLLPNERATLPGGALETRVVHVSSSGI